MPFFVAIISAEVQIQTPILATLTIGQGLVETISAFINKLQICACGGKCNTIGTLPEDVPRACGEDWIGASVECSIRGSNDKSPSNKIVLVEVLPSAVALGHSTDNDGEQPLPPPYLMPIQFIVCQTGAS